MYRRYEEACDRLDAVRSLSYYFDEDGNESEADEQLGDLTKTDLFWDILFGRTYVCCGCYMLKSARFFDIYPNRSIPVYPVGQNFQMLLPYMYHYKCGTLEEKLYGVFKRSGSHSRLPLSKEEEYQKYEHYEHMIDDLAEIAGITDREELRQIAYWKANRRFQINMRYHAYGKSIRALLDLILSRQVEVMDILRKLKWILHAWIKDVS